MRSDAKLSKCVGHAKEKEKKEAKAIRSGGELEHREFWPFLCVSSKVSKKHKSESFSLRRCSPCDEIERSTV